MCRVGNKLLLSVDGKAQKIMNVLLLQRNGALFFFINRANMIFAAQDEIKYSFI